MTDEIRYPRPLDVRYADIFEEIAVAERQKRQRCQGAGCRTPAIGPLLNTQGKPQGFYCRLCGDRLIARLQKGGITLHRL